VPAVGLVASALLHASLAQVKRAGPAMKGQMVTSSLARVATPLLAWIRIRRRNEHVACGTLRQHLRGDGKKKNESEQHLERSLASGSANLASFESFP
jgi:hypothetical protein